MFPHRKRVCVISLDGVPGSLLEEAFAQGRLSSLRSLWQDGGVAHLRSTIPPMSSVAWATYATGVGPGDHGIFGFVDRDPTTMRLRFLTSWDVASETIWEFLGKTGRSSMVINLPLTWPARPLRGWLVAGFPVPDLDKAAYPPELTELIKNDYVVDPDPALASVPEDFLTEINRALNSLRRVVLSLASQPWDFFHLHIMVTDRLNHFFFRSRHPNGAYHHAFWEIYEEVAEFVVEVVSSLPSGAELVLMSDHGFSDLAWEVDLNAFLFEAGLLHLPKGISSELAPSRLRLGPDSVAYSLTPGRIYLLRRGRERDGWIGAIDAERWLERVIAALEKLKTPDGPAISDILVGKEVYQGAKAGLGPDLLAIPAPGVELHGGWEGDSAVQPANRQGGHTLDGAFIWVRNRVPKNGTILDLPTTVWRLLGLPSRSKFQGKVLVNI